MTDQRHPPLIAQCLIRFFAGPEMEDSILGDLEEQFGNKQRARAWYWRQTALSVPSLLGMNIYRLSQRRLLMEAWFLLLAFTLIWAWEIYVARQSAWPLAKQLLAYSPLNAGNTCRAVYIVLYAGFTACLLAGIAALSRRFGKGRHFQAVHLILLALVASLPIIYLCLFPLVTDGSNLFRVSQLGAVWAVLLSVFLIPEAVRARPKFRFYTV